MVNVGIATGAEQPINRDGRVPGSTLEEGDLVGLDANGELVKADADAATAIHALGVALSPVEDESGYVAEAVKDALHSEVVTLQNGQRVAYIRYGIILENSDEDWGFAPSEPVYLGVGGGFTQTKPSTAGEVVQYVGYAIDDGEALFLEVDGDYATV